MKALRIFEYVCYAAVLICAALQMQGCNAAKKVMRNQDDFNKVGEAWSKEHPCVNDTVSTTLPGDTITLYSTLVTDSTYNENTGTDTIVKVQLRTRTVYRTVRDTLVKYVTDTRAIKVLQNQQARLRDSLTQSLIERNNYKAGRNSWRGIVYAICGIALLLIVGLYFFFTYHKKQTLAHTALSKQTN